MNHDIITAIDSSTDHGQIVTISVDTREAMTAAVEALYAAADAAGYDVDEAAQPDITEVWACDGDQQVWRVHVEVAA